MTKFAIFVMPKRYKVSDILKMRDEIPNDGLETVESSSSYDEVVGGKHIAC